MVRGEKRFLAHETLKYPLIMGTFLNLYILSCGNTVQDLLFLQTVLSVCVVVAEIPTGIIGDKFGIKLCLIATNLAEIACLLLLLLGTKESIVTYAVLHALSTALNTSSEPVYLSRFVNSDIESYNRLSAKSGRLRTIKQLVTLFLLGILFEMKNIYVIYFQLTITIIRLIITFSLVNVDNNTKTDKSDGNLNLKNMLHEIIYNKKLLALLLIAIMPAVTTRIAELYLPTICLSLNIQAKQQSYISMLSTIIGLITPILYTKHYDKIKDKVMLIMVILDGTGILIANMNGYIALTGYILLLYTAGCIYSLFIPRAVCYHSNNNSKNTILSLMSLIKTLVYMLFTFCLSKLDTTVNGLYIATGFIIPLLLLSILNVNRVFKNNKE